MAIGRLKGAFLRGHEGLEVISRGVIQMVSEVAPLEGAGKDVR